MADAMGGPEWSNSVLDGGARMVQFSVGFHPRDQTFKQQTDNSTRSNQPAARTGNTINRTDNTINGETIAITVL